jgi:hypothetical protein
VFLQQLRKIQKKNGRWVLIGRNCIHKRWKINNKYSIKRIVPVHQVPIAYSSLW